MGNSTSKSKLTEQDKTIRREKIVRIIGIGGVAIIGLIGLTAIIVGSVASFGVLPTALVAVLSLGPIAAKCMLEITKYTKNRYRENMNIEALKAKNEFEAEMLQHDRSMNESAEKYMAVLRKTRKNKEELNRLTKAQSDKDTLMRRVHTAIEKNDKEVIAEIFCDSMEHFDMDNIKCNVTKDTNTIEEATLFCDNFAKTVDKATLVCDNFAETVDEFNEARPSTAEQTKEPCVKHYSD